MERQAEVWAWRVWRTSKDGYEIILTVPSPVVAKRWRSGEEGVEMWCEKVVALVWMGWGCGSRAV